MMFRVNKARYIKKGVQDMKRISKKLFLIIALLNVAILNASTISVVSYYKARPQGLNGARKVSGEVPGGQHVHLYDQEEWYATAWITAEYTRTFRPDRIAECLFGDDLTGNKNCRTIKIQGSAKPGGRDEKAWLADYFYLPETFDGTISFEPRISNFVLDFNFYLGLDDWWSGGYFRLYGPLVHTRRDLNFKETILSNNGAMGAGKFSPVQINNPNLLNRAENFFSGSAPTSPLFDQESTTTIERKALRFAKMGCQECSCNCTGHRTENGFSELRAELGWNFWQDKNYHFGLNIQAAAPAADRPKAAFLFDAVVGNGKHWELGGGATFHYVFWSSQDEAQHFGFYGDFNVTHLFDAHQQRTFDLKNKPLSRYMLAAKHDTNVSNGLAGANNAGDDDNAAGDSSFQFAGVYEPVANLTTQDVKVSVGAQIDLTAWLNYSWQGFSWDLGYNFWYSSCEKIRCVNKCPSPRLRTEENTWALKGDAHIFGFRPNNASDSNLSVALAVSQSNATINKGTNA